MEPIRVLIADDHAIFRRGLCSLLGVVPGIEIIGEAASKISRPVRDAHPEIPWQSIIGMRNRLVHEYFRIDLPTVWKIVQNDIPALIAQIEPLIPPEEEV